MPSFVLRRFFLSWVAMRFFLSQSYHYPFHLVNRSVRRTKSLQSNRVIEATESLGIMKHGNLSVPIIGSSLSTIELLTMSFSELSARIGGSGKARLLWENLRIGMDPLLDMEMISEHALSNKAKTNVRSILEGSPLIHASVVNEVLSDCGTRKLLLRLQDHLSVESVLIPSYKYDRTTLCISTQIG